MKIEPVDPTPKEIKQRVAEQQEKVMGEARQRGEYKDIFTVDNADKGFDYCWLNTKKDLLESGQWRDKWEIVNSLNSPKVETIGKQMDGTHVIGDAILARRPKSISEAIRREQEELRQRRLRKIEGEFREEGRRLGIKTFNNEE